jgi:anthranilate phosphoribosyltransferase
VHGHGGLDELTTTGANQVSELRNGEVRTYTLEPEELGFKRGSVEDLIGGDAAHNANILRGILAGVLNSVKRDVVLLNAGAAIVAGGVADTLQQGIDCAAQSIDSGAALAKLEALIAVSQRFAL